MISVLQTGWAELERALPQLTGTRAGDMESVTTPEDQRYAARRRHFQDAYGALSSRATLRLLAAHRLGRAPKDAAELEISRTCRRCGGQHGQPTLAGLSLSSSRSRMTALAGAGDPEGLLGVDVEALPPQLFPGFDDYVLHPAERCRMRNSGGWPPRRRMALWVMKEAVLKVTGMGLDHPPHQMRLGPATATTVWISGRTSRPLPWRRVIEAADPDVEGLWTCVIPGADGAVSATGSQEPHDVHDLGPEIGLPGPRPLQPSRRSHQW